MRSASSSFWRQVLAHQQTIVTLRRRSRSGTARDLHRFPPADIRVKGAPQVVLLDLALIQRPPMVLVLADVKPRPGPGPAGGPAPRSNLGFTPVMHPVAREPALRPLSADGPRPSGRPRHGAAGQLSSRPSPRSSTALSGSTTTSTLPTSSRAAMNTRSRRSRSSLRKGRTRKIQTGHSLQPPHRALDRVKVRRSHPQRPRQQQQRGVLRPKVRTAMASRELVPPNLNARTVYADVA